MPTALTIRKVDGKPGSVYYPLELITTPSSASSSTLSPTQVVIRITHCALNHRDLFIRQHLYPGTTFGVPLFADGCGLVTSTGSSPSAKKWLQKRVIINPGSGWKDAPAGPEDETGYKILGGTKVNPQGTGVTEFVAEESELEIAPEHLSGEEAAALPLTGLTAWRAVHTKAGVRQGQNVLVTGIGGGVAIMALLFAVKAGANVWVSSGSEEKRKRAVEMGAKGAVNYKEAGWEKKLLEMLPEKRKTLDAIIDGAGGDVVEKSVRLMKPGGVIVVYGMTTGPKMPWLMAATLKNIELKGSTMGSRKEFGDMVRFVADKEVKPVVERCVKGLKNLEGIDGLFETMKKGEQFGKLVIEVVDGDREEEAEGKDSKL